MPQLRQNIITGEWVVFAPERAKRPSDYVYIGHQKKQSKKDCPFCKDSKNSEYPRRIKKFDRETTYIVPNKFPAFIEDKEKCSPTQYLIEDKFYKMRLSLGGHDVIVVDDHDQILPTFTPSIWRDLLANFKQRYQYFEELCNVEYVMPIYNHGPEAAASIKHPHAQIFSSSIVPNSIARETVYTSRYFSENKSCPFCELILHEKEQNTRVLFENDSFISFNFYAARFPFETWILPKRHESHYKTITTRGENDLIDIMRSTFNCFEKVLKNPPLNFYIHSSPATHSNEKLPYYHWHIEILPRLSNYGGYELGSNIIIDVITPEQAADFLRIGIRT